MKVLLSRWSLSRNSRLDLPKLHEMSVLSASADTFESSLLLLVKRRRAERVAEASDAGKNARTLHALCKAAKDAKSVLVIVSFDFYVCCHMKGNTSIEAIFWQIALII